MVACTPCTRSTTPPLSRSPGCSSSHQSSSAETPRYSELPSCTGELRRPRPFLLEDESQTRPMTTTLDLSTAPDEELGRRLRDGDEGAFTALYERYSVPIHDFLVRTMR